MTLFEAFKEVIFSGGLIVLSVCCFWGVIYGLGFFVVGSNKKTRALGLCAALIGATGLVYIFGNENKIMKTRRSFVYREQISVQVENQ